MQSAKLPKIKLVTTSQIRLIHHFPTSITELFHQISLLTPLHAYTLTYNSGKPINTDSDLQDSLQWAINKPSLKLFLNPLPSPSCSSCTKSSFFPIFHCPDCQFYLCSACEPHQIHEHALIKAQNLDQLKKFCSNRMNPKSFLKDLQRFEKNLIKGKVLKHLLEKDCKVKTGEKIIAGWTVLNCGEIDWPEGCALVWKKGELKSKDLVFGPVAVGKNLELRVGIRVGEVVGEVCGNWEIIVRGVSVLKLKERVRVV